MSSASSFHILNPNSRFLPPPIRTHSASRPRSYGNDSERAACFLNQDWCSPVESSSPSSSDRYRLSTRAVFPQSRHKSPSDESHSSDDCIDELDHESDIDYPVKREQFSPSISTRTSLSSSPILSDQYQTASESSLPRSDPIIPDVRPYSPPARSPLRTTRRAPWNSTQFYGGRSFPLPAALHPSNASSRNSPTLPPIAALDASINYSSRPSHFPLSHPPLSTPSPPLVIKPETSSSSIPYVHNNTPDVDDHIQKTGSSKSTCVWRKDNGTCGFQSSSSLVKRHIRTVHLKIRPVTCPVCKQGFSTKFHLKTHSNIHTGDKPYSCPDCSKTFSNPSSKHHHRVRYHGYVQTWRHYGDKDKKR